MGGEWKLLDCPFCGSAAEVERPGTRMTSAIYCCTDCGCSMEASDTHNLGASWNRRASPLTADLTKTAPGGALDDSTFSEIEDALDKAEAPMKLDGKWLTLPQRISALCVVIATLREQAEKLCARWEVYVRDKPDKGDDYLGYYAGHGACAVQLRAMLAASPPPPSGPAWGEPDGWMHPNGAIWRRDNCPSWVGDPADGWIPFYATPASSGLNIKPLEWSYFGGSGDWVASPIHNWRYFVRKSLDGWRVDFESSTIGGHWSSSAEAKAAAQLDHEVRSALTPSPSYAEGVEAAALWHDAQADGLTKLAGQQDILYGHDTPYRNAAKVHRQSAEAIRALAGKPPAEDGDGWLDISTAPKDHFPVLTWSRHDGQVVAFLDVTWAWWSIPN